MNNKQKKEIRADAKNHVLTGGAFPNYDSDDGFDVNVFFQSIGFDEMSADEEELFLETLEELEGEILEVVSKWKP